MRPLTLAILAALCLPSSAGTLYHNWTIGWRHLAPDGFPRPVITVNQLWPPPVIIADVGDTIIVDIDNQLGNESVSIHWHGMFQRGSAAMDGASMVSQCPIPPGGLFRYEFTAEPPGTHWWHSMNKGQAADGLRGMLIVRNRIFDLSLGVWKEYFFTLSDW
jgi:iron transport multicopper oxidase